MWLMGCTYSREKGGGGCREREGELWQGANPPLAPGHTHKRGKEKRKEKPHSFRLSYYIRPFILFFSDYVPLKHTKNKKERHKGLQRPQAHLNTSRVYKYNVIIMNGGARDFPDRARPSPSTWPITKASKHVVNYPFCPYSHLNWFLRACVVDSYCVLARTGFSSSSLK